jgi:cytochrome P450
MWPLKTVNTAATLFQRVRSFFHSNGGFSSVAHGLAVLIDAPLARGLLQNPDTYPEPSLFSPERHLTQLDDGSWKIREDVTDPRKFAFGFGRRICPGMHIAEQAMFAILTTVLQTLDIMRVKDCNGENVIPEARMSSGLLCHPLPFAYALRARPDARHLVDLCVAVAGDSSS